MPRCYKWDKSNISLVVRESLTSNDVNTEAEEATALEAITRQQQMKIQQTEETSCVL
jgi:hypothetical protein